MVGEWRDAGDRGWGGRKGEVKDPRLFSKPTLQPSHHPVQSCRVLPYPSPPYFIYYMLRVFNGAIMYRLSHLVLQVFFFGKCGAVEGCSPPEFTHSRYWTYLELLNTRMYV